MKLGGLILLGGVNLLVALSFSSLYFKRAFTTVFWKILFIYLVFNGLLGLAGFFIGLGLSPLLDQMAFKAGMVLLLVVGIKLFLKGFRTKTVNRIFDIGKTSTLIGLLFALNLDLLLVASGISMMFSPSCQILNLTLLISATFGILIGNMIGNKVGYFFSNLMDILAAGLLFTMVLIWFFR